MSVGSTSNTSFQSIQSLNLSSVDVELLSIVLQGQQTKIRVDQLQDLAKTMEVTRQRILQAIQLKKEAGEAVKDVLAKAAQKEKQEFQTMRDRLESGDITVDEFEEWAEEHGVDMPDFPFGASREEKLELMLGALDDAEEKLDQGKLSSPALDKLIAEEFKINPLVAGVNSGLQSLGINAKLDSVESLKTVLSSLDAFIQRETEKLEALKEQVKALTQLALNAFRQFNAQQESGRDNALSLESRLDSFRQDLQNLDLNSLINQLNPSARGTTMTPDPLQLRLDETIKQIDETVNNARAAVEKMEQLYREHGIDPRDMQKYMENLSPSDRERVQTDLATWKGQLEQEISDEIRRQLPERSTNSAPNSGANSSNTLPGFRGIRV